MNKSYVIGKYFFGNEISSYGQEHGYVDYRTLAKAFDAILSNGIISATQNIGYWELVNGAEYYHSDSDGNYYTYDEMCDKVEELEKEMAKAEENEDDERIAEIQSEIDYIQQEHYYENFQYFIISNNGAEILQDYTNEIVYYNEELDIYVWCVTHWGTSWDYVLTDIKCNVNEEEE